MTQTMNDEDKVQGLMSGDPKVWGDLPSDEAGLTNSGVLGLIYRWAIHDVHDPDVAKDLAIEVAGRLIRYLKTFKYQSSFNSWLQAVYRSVLYKKAPGSHQRIKSRLEDWLKTVDKRGQIQKEVTQRAIKRLPSDVKQVMRLICAGNSSKQSAESLEIHVTAVRGLKSLGLTRLIEDQDFLDMLIRVGNRAGKDKDRLAENILIELKKISEISLDAVALHNSVARFLG